MTFYKWLEKWANGNDDRRDVWGAMAEYIRKMFHDIPDKTWAFWGLARVLGFKEGTAECWMFSELFMKWEDCDMGKR